MAAGARLEGVTTFDALPPLRLQARSPRVYAIRRVLSYLHSAAGIHELERRFSAYEPSASVGGVVMALFGPYNRRQATFWEVREIFGHRPSANLAVPA